MLNLVGRGIHWRSHIDAGAKIGAKADAVNQVGTVMAAFQVEELGARGGVGMGGGLALALRIRRGLVLRKRA